MQPAPVPPKPVVDPTPLSHQKDESPLVEDVPIPPPAQEHKPPVAPPPLDTKKLRTTKMRDTYQRLKTMKSGDIELELHEQLRNLDKTWLKRLLVAVVGEHAVAAKQHSGNDVPVLVGKDSAGSVLLLQDMLAPHLTCHAILLTCKPTRLTVADDVDLGTAPFRVTFIGAALDLWESSDIERLDALSIDLHWATAISHSQTMLNN